MLNTLSKSINIKAALWTSLKAVAACIVSSTVATWVIVAWMIPQLQQRYSPEAMNMLVLMWHTQLAIFEACVIGALAWITSRFVIQGFGGK